MNKPRKIEYEFDANGKSYFYWEQYAEALEKYIEYLESINSLI